jgi:hypothetical protein
MKIIASPTARVAVFEPSGPIVPHRYLTAAGVYDAKIKAVIAPCLDVPEKCVPAVADYYASALSTGDAVPCDEKGKALPPPTPPKPAAKAEKEAK